MFAFKTSAQIPFNEASVTENIIPQISVTEQYEYIDNTGCDAVDDVRVMVCDGTRPLISWDVAGQTGSKQLANSNATNPDVAVLIYQRARYFAVVAYYVPGTNGVFVEGYEWNFGTSEFDLMAAAPGSTNPSNEGWQTGASCIGTVNIDAYNDNNLNFVVVFDVISTNLHNCIAVPGTINTTSGYTLVLNHTGVKLGIPGNNSLLVNEQPDVSLAYDFNQGDPFYATYFTYLTIDGSGNTKINVLENKQYPTYNDLDDGTSTNNVFWNEVPATGSYFAHPAITSHPDYALYPHGWVAAVEHDNTTLNDINMYTARTPPAMDTYVPTTDLNASLHLSTYRNYKPVLSFDFANLAVDLAWNFDNINYAPLFYEPIAVRYNFTQPSPNYEILGQASSTSNLFTEVSEKIFSGYDNWEHSLAVSIGGRWASPVSGGSYSEGKLYSFYDDYDNQWCYKTVDGNMLRMANNTQMNSTTLFSDAQLQNQLNKLSENSFGDYILHSIDGKNLLHSSGNASTVANELNSKLKILPKGIYILSLSKQNQPATQFKVVNY